MSMYVCVCVCVCVVGMGERERESKRYINFESAMSILCDCGGARALDEQENEKKIPRKNKPADQHINVLL